MGRTWCVFLHICCHKEEAIYFQRYVLFLNCDKCRQSYGIFHIWFCWSEVLIHGSRGCHLPYNIEARKTRSFLLQVLFYICHFRTDYSISNKVLNWMILFPFQLLHVHASNHYVCWPDASKLWTVRIYPPNCTWQKIASIRLFSR